MASAGLVLLVSLFLPWYSEPALADASATGWEAFTVVDILLALLAIAAVAAIPVTAGPSTPTPSITYETLVSIAALAGSVLVLVRLLDPPRTGLSRDVGCYLGVLATLGLFAACLVAMRDERASAPGHLTDSTGRPIAAAPSIQTLPAPRP